MVSVRSVFKTAGLAGTGFVLGLIGLSAYTGTPLSRVQTVLLHPTKDDANACYDTKGAQQEIYFLSCGGIY